jgi:hypothetical protein
VRYICTVHGLLPWSEDREDFASDELEAIRVVESGSRDDALVSMSEISVRVKKDVEHGGTVGLLRVSDGSETSSSSSLKSKQYR